MRFLVAEKLGPHKFKTPEGYLICTDAILSRTGKQEYKRCEIFGDACDEPDEIVNIDRTDDEVFSDKAMASFENKPICIEHPDEDVNIENHNKLAVGFTRDIHKGEDNGHPVMMGTLVITDKDAVEAVESGEYKELSCGYDCDINDDDNPQQRNIRGNHVALCKHGRAGIARIVDSVDDVGIKVWQVRQGYAIVAKRYWKQYGKNAFVDATESSIEAARYHRGSLEYNDKMEFVIIDCNDGKYKIEDSKMKDIQSTTAPVTDKIIYVMQSDVDKNLYFYIGKTFSMKEGEWGYTKFEMGNTTPEQLKSDLLKNGWHAVSQGVARIIDASNEEWTVVEEENYEKANEAFIKDNDADVDKLQQLIAETLSARADAWRNDKQKELNQAKESIANAIDANQKVRSDIKSFYTLPEYVRQIAERRARSELKRYDALLNIQHKIYEKYESLMKEANSLAKIIEAKYHVKLNLGLHRSGGEREAKRILKTIRKQSDSLKDACIGNAKVADSKEQLFTVEYKQDGVMYIRKVRASSIEDAISKAKDVYNKFEHETDKEYLKSSINEMSRYIRNWSFMTAREKRNISPEGLGALKQMLKFAQQRLAELK